MGWAEVYRDSHRQAKTGNKRNFASSRTDRPNSSNGPARPCGTLIGVFNISRTLFSLSKACSSRRRDYTVVFLWALLSTMIAFRLHSGTVEDQKNESFLKTKYPSPAATCIAADDVESAWRLVEEGERTLSARIRARGVGHHFMYYLWLLTCFSMNMGCSTVVVHYVDQPALFCASRELMGIAWRITRTSNPPHQ